MPADYKIKIWSFRNLLLLQGRNHVFEFGQISNKDKVPLNVYVPLKRTVKTKGAKLITIKTSGHNKPHYTDIMCCAEVIKLPLLLIFNQRTMSKITFF
jgi:hypothetical protein